MNVIPNRNSGKLSPGTYWRLWLFNAVLVSAGMLFFLASHYATSEFWGKAYAMALLPFIAVMVLVGGAGSTLFALTKVMIEKRSLNFISSLALLVGPALATAFLLLLFGSWHSPKHRLAYICLGNAPANASDVQVAGYSTFLRAEWLAAFKVDTNGFQNLVTKDKLNPVPPFAFSERLGRSSLKQTQLFRRVSLSGKFVCYQRTFNEGKEHKLGCIYAAFDPATSTAMVLREYQD